MHATHRLSISGGPSPPSTAAHSFCSQHHTPHRLPLSRQTGHASVRLLQLRASSVSPKGLCSSPAFPLALPWAPSGWRSPSPPPAPRCQPVNLPGDALWQQRSSGGCRGAQGLFPPQFPRPRAVRSQRDCNRLRWGNPLEQAAEMHCQTRGVGHKYSRVYSSGITPAHARSQIDPWAVKTNTPNNLISRTATRGNRKSNLEGLLCSKGDSKTSLLQLRFLFSFGKPQREKWVPLGAGGTNGWTRVPAGQGTPRVFPPADRRVKSIQGRLAGRCFFQPPGSFWSRMFLHSLKLPWESTEVPSFLPVCHQQGLAGWIMQPVPSRKLSVDFHGNNRLEFNKQSCQCCLRRNRSSAFFLGRAGCPALARIQDHIIMLTLSA